MDLRQRYPLTTRVLEILATGTFLSDPERILGAVADFHRLCSTWNLAAKLMSKSDLETAFDEHVADSLALVPYVHQFPDHHYVDIGSGGGFPAVPIALALPSQRTTLLERSQVKADFLRQLPRALPGLDIEVKMGQFPDVAKRSGPTVYTARAVEKPLLVDSAIVSRLESGDVYLMQREVPESIRATGISIVEINDPSSRAGLRRGILNLIKR